MKTCLFKIVLLIVVPFSISFGQQVSLVKDINNSANNNGSSPYYTIALGSSVVFVANDPLTGSELWISNGSSAGTTLIKDIYPGGYSSSISGLVNIGGTIYFTANDGVNGRELWKTNGTPAGTVMVKDINPGPGNSSPSLFTLFNGFVYFRATTDAAGTELWKTDGTTANTVLVEDINPGNGGSSPSEFTALGSSFLIFRASTPANGSELYSYNGGTLNFLDIVAGASGSSPSEIKYNSTLGLVFFRAYNATSGSELWKTNGNFSTGTSVIDIEAGAGSSYPSYITSQGGFVYFNAYKATTGYELYRSNGTTTGLVGTELYAGTGSSNPYYLTATGGGGLFFFAYDGANYAIRYTTGTSISTIGGTTGISVDQIIANPSSANIYFSAYTVTTGYELWTATSTTASLIKDIVSGSGSSYPYYFAFTGSIFFSADNGTAGNELWVSDGTGTNTVIVKDINSATDSNIYSAITTSTGFLVSANDGVNGQELWKSDGTSLGTVLVEDILPGAGGSSPDFLGRIGTTYFFSAYDNVNGTEIWKSDGATTGGTLLLTDIEPGINGSYPYGGVVMGSFLYFIAYTSANGYELWRTNGTTTSLVQDIYPGIYSSYPSSLTVVGTTLFFTAEDATNGNELWKYDGTTASMVKNINLSGYSYPYYLTNVNGKLFFQADDGVTGYELWTSDGTSAGTTSPKDINSGIGASYPYNIVALGSTAYFVADDGINGTELWKSDGTLAGTVLVKDIYTGAGNSSYPSYLTVANSRLYFTAYEPTTGTEIYKSDGSSANTGLLKDIRSGSGSSNAYNLTNLNETLYFTASDGSSGNLLHKSNGATAFPASSAGVQYDLPGRIIYYNGKVIFTANTNSFGNEPLTVMSEPLNQPTALNFTGRTGTSITASFTAAAGSPSAPSGYIVLRKTGSAPTDLPVDGTTYTVGATLGTSTVAAIGAGTSFTDNFTGSATPPIFYYAIYSFNNDGTANIYRAISPLQGNRTPFALEPTAQPTAFNKSSITTTSFTVSFTAASGPPTGYIVLRKGGAVAPTEVPVDGTEYTLGGTIGTSTVAYVGTAATFPQTALTANTSYSYAIFSYNGSTGTYNYLTTGPLTGTVSTLVAAPTAQPTALVFSNVGSQTLTGNFTAATGAPAGYLVIRKKDSAPTGNPAGGVTYVVGDAIGDATVAYAGAATTFNDTGLLGESTYHYEIFSFNGSGITTNYLTTTPLTNSQLTLANEPASQPTALVFSNVTTSSFTVSFTAAAGPPTGYLAVRKNGSSPTGVPQDGTIYTVGTALGDGTVAFVGAGVTFNETLAIAPYAYDIFAYNGNTGTINYLVTSPLENTLSLDNTPPVITNETAATVSSPTTTQLKIVASITENESSISAGSVKVEYRSISSGSAFSAPQDMVLNSGKWEFSAPASANGEMGVEYKITATNSQNLNASVTSKASLSFSDASGLLIPYASFGSDVSNYRIISIPLELSSKSVSAVLVDDLAASDKKNWRIFRHDNSTNKNVEMTTSSNIDTGKGYWLIVKESKTMDTGPGTTVAATQSEPYTINLATGWNLIGNPYNFNVLWSDVKTASGVAGTLDLVTYDGSYNESDSKLDKFEGGFVFATSALALKFPVTKNPAAGGRESTITKTKNLNALDQPNWEVALRLRNGDKVSGFGGIGMNENANGLEDEFDGFTLPRFLEYMEVNHTKRFHDIAYTKDIVPSSQNHEWEFTVETNLSGNTELSWDNSYFGNNDNAALKLWDVEEQRAVDMKKINSYSLNGKASKSFRIFYGNKEFVNDKTELKSLMVHSVSPNPTHGQSNISFSLPGEKEALVQVRVLNMLGQPIASVYNGMLAGGYNEVTWNGKDHSDTKPPQGIYLVEIQSNNQTRVVKLVVN
jgi:trimeric autotransporter adhesin